MSSRLI